MKEIDASSPALPAPAATPSIEPRVSYERSEDMSPDGKLMLMMEDDGDMIVTIYEPHELYGPRMASAQFCTYSGGGRSPKVREALIALAAAIQEENQTNPQRREAPKP